MIVINSIRPGTVSVLIGRNGSGKSRLLRKLCVDYLNRGENVIAIAPTIYDRFVRMPKRGLRFFGARQGRKAAIQVVRLALERASSVNPQILKYLTRALEYTNFDPVVGIRLTEVNLNNFPAAKEHLSVREAEELEGALLKWQNRKGHSDTVRLRMDSFSYDELDTLTFAILARHDELLFRTKTASRIEYYLYRNDEPISLLEACSGEICFITTIAFISTEIQEHSVIAIDEPDTSLHPTWQQTYVKTLLDLFSYYEPRILISTHSPIIISGAEVASQAVSVFEMKEGTSHVFDHAKLSLEEMYDRLFELITPKNHYLSQRAASLLKDLNSRKMNIDEVLQELHSFSVKSYDSVQQNVIRKVEQLAVAFDDKRSKG